MGVPDPDVPQLLGAVADALNKCERAGIAVTLAGGAAQTDHGYVMAVGDRRLGTRWAARLRAHHPMSPEPGPDDD